MNRLGKLTVFLCHASSDKSNVRRLYHRLKSQNVNPWLDEEKLLPGQDWEREIRKSVRDADAVIICLSKSSLTKEGFIQREIRYALDVADEKPDGTIFLIPLRLEPCDVPDRLNRWHWVDLFEAQGFGRLIQSLEMRAQSLGRELPTRPPSSNSNSWVTGSGGDISLHLTPKLPCLLLLDVSGSMMGEPIWELNRGIRLFLDDLMTDRYALERIELALVTFGESVLILRDFAQVVNFSPPFLQAGGPTPMGTALEAGLNLIDHRKRIYAAQGIPYYRPLLLLLTDGEPTDSWTAAVNRLNREIESHSISFIPVGLGKGLDLAALRRLFPQATSPIMLRELRFSQMFRWLSTSISSVFRVANANLTLPNPNEWGEF